MDEIILFLSLLVIGVGILVIPPLLTIINLFNLFARNKWKKNLIDGSILVLGVLLTLLLYCMVWNPLDWNEPLYIFMELNYHAPIASWHEATLAVISFAALLGYVVLRFIPKELPPILSVLCLSACYLGCGLGAAWCIQLCAHLGAGVYLPFEGLYLCLFPLNFIITTISLIKDMILKSSLIEEKRESVFAEHCRILLCRSKHWPWLALIFMWGLLGILLMILILFGQQPDAIVKAFTETSDWTFSQKISPPTIYYDAHYLCTVAAGGHPKVVKPQRMGKRHGHLIVVNRQLCIANAFEDYISQKMPHFHRWIRYVYDKYGYPLSKHIRTPLAADVTYLLMKPLEWIFLIFLYTFDAHPENRIARQYLP